MTKTAKEVFEERKEALEKGEQVAFQSTVCQKQTLRIMVKVRMPETASIKNLLAELKSAEARLNTNTEFEFKFDELNG